MGESILARKICRSTVYANCGGESYAEGYVPDIEEI